MRLTQTKTLGLLLLIIGLGLAGLGLSFLLSLPQFQATARIKVEPDPPPNSSGQEEMSYDPYFIQTTFEVIQSEVILSNVVTALHLETAWGNQFANGRKLSCPEAMDRLKEHMLLAPIHNTKLIAVRVRSEDPIEASTIANAICDAYANYRDECRKQLIAKSLEALQRAYDKQATDIQNFQTNLALLRNQYGIRQHEEYIVDSNPTLLEKTTPAEKANAIREYDRTKPFWEAKLKFKELNEQHQLFKAKMEALRADASIPKNPMVQMVDFATPPTQPIGPNRLLGVVPLAFGLITALGGWLLLMMEPKSG